MLTALLLADYKEIKYWFKNQTGTKVFIAAGFSLIGLTISIGLYLVSRSFFFFLTPFNQYGFLMADYLLHGSIIITFWFSLATSINSLFNLFLNNKETFAYLITQPIPPSTINRWIFIKTVFINLTLFLIIFFPISLAFSQVFLTLTLYQFILRFSLIVLFLVFTAYSLSIFIIFSSYRLLHKTTLFLKTTGITLFILSIIFLIELLFPQGLTQLYQASPKQFPLLYQRLPLSNPYLPSHWINQAMSKGFTPQVFLLTVLLLLIIIGSLSFQDKKLVPFIQLNQGLAFEKKKPAKISLSLISSPPFSFSFKDLLSILRRQSEKGYLYLLFSIGFLFFFFLSRAISFKTTSNWQNEIVVFSFFWIIFFSTALFLRIAYPLIAAEGPHAWFIFTQPLPPLFLLISKIAVSLIISLPLIVFSVLIWYLLPLGETSQVLTIGLTTIAILTLAIINPILGAVFPDFNNGNNPEKVTTNLMGLITLFINLIFGSLSGLLLYHYLKKNLTLEIVILILAITSAGLVCFFGLIAKQGFKKYQF